MIETVNYGVSPLSFMRLPRFHADDRRSPAQAVLHGLPAFVFLSLNVWIVGMGLISFIAAYFSIPAPFAIGAAAVMAVPFSMLSWGLFIQCVEVEAVIEE